MCQNNLFDAALDFDRVDPNNPHTTQDDGLLLPAVRDAGLLLPAVQDNGLLLPAVQFLLGGPDTRPTESLVPTDQFADRHGTLIGGFDLIA